jgi:hypothetical protein
MKHQTCLVTVCMYLVTEVEIFFRGKRECSLPLEAVICSLEGLEESSLLSSMSPHNVKKGSFLAKGAQPHNLFLLSLHLYLTTPQTNKQPC